MVDCSVLVPMRGAIEALERQLPQLLGALQGLQLSHEIVCLDDGTTDDVAWRALMRRHDCLRVLRSDRTAGLSASLSACIAASRGELIVAIAAGTAYRADDIPQFITRLARADLVYGRRRLEPLAKFWQRLSRIPRWLMLGLEVHDPDCLFWAARREAVAGLELARGMFRYLPWLVALRGFRVSEIRVDYQGPLLDVSDGRPNPGDLLATWWLTRRWHACQARELAADRTEHGAVHLFDPNVESPSSASQLTTDRRESA